MRIYPLFIVLAIVGCAQPAAQPPEPAITQDQAVVIARRALEEKLGDRFTFRDSLAIPEPENDATRWHVFWPGNPAGGTHYGWVIIDKATGVVHEIRLFPGR